VFRPQRERLLGSARVWRAGDGILLSRTFVMLPRSEFQLVARKVRCGRMPQPARCKRALPRSSGSRSSGTRL